ncbi:MAJOR FACILITATOR SUPERFAMILY TRANSPORTER 16 ISOFORM B [Salix koriyanagi]|uniref:MAJOR FACILITATOR SUPERFAMILY TRANSPORTER 16 ISOFORM B n=1 Tax=Salix koriyanagi TaxID=2511006 RepID=A0A9Q0Q6Y2_9ROSI|nr:MAJOR FACILITATOR SUPERFAMILY TRANSPORTER 16 ISOFORM B [Salix koriyanagi]
MVAGFAQATGWPCVLAVITSWIERNGRGWKMGVWNAHSTVGNIIGSLLAAFLNFSLWLGMVFSCSGGKCCIGRVARFLLLDSQS